jgi:hypothetical protein
MLERSIVLVRVQAADPPIHGIRLNTDEAFSMAKTRGRLRILLELGRVLSAEEMGVLGKTVQKNKSLPIVFQRLS